MRKLFLILFCIFFVPYVSAQRCGPFDPGKLASAEALERPLPEVLKKNIENLKAGRNKTGAIVIIERMSKWYSRFFLEDDLNALSIILESDPDNTVKEAIGRILLTVGTEPALAKLKGALKNANSATRLAVLNVFMHEKKLVKPMILDAMKDPDPAIRMKIASACESSIFAEDLEILNALAALAEDDPDLGVKEGALHTLMALEEHVEKESNLATPTVIPKEIKDCFEAIASAKDKKIKQAAADKIIVLGKSFLPTITWELLEIIANEDPDARYYAAVALKGMGDKTAITALKSGIHYEEVPYVRSMMEDALKHLQSLPD